MHKCVRCGRAATSLQEINDGCPCGSKVFIFDKQVVFNPSTIAGEDTTSRVAVAGKTDGGPVAPGGTGGLAGKGNANIAGIPAPKTEWAAEATVSRAKTDADGRAPESYHARMSFTSEDVENIKVLSEGVFALELHSLSKDPVVLKDEEGVYYVKIPFEQNGKAKQNSAERKGTARKETKK